MEVTTLAIEKLKEVMQEQGETEGSLRVVAIPAETGGLQYMLTMETCLLYTSPSPRDS